MTPAALKSYIASQLTAPVNQVQKVINSFNEVVDFITAQHDVIPTWTALLEFNTDGSGNGAYCIHPDSNGAIRFWKTKTSANIGNEPPTNPATTEDTHWIEVSPSDRSAINEWSAGVYGDGLVIVYHNHSSFGPNLYVLLEPVRPYESTNIETEITAGDWASLIIAPDPEKFTRPITQAAHGLATGNAITINGSGNFIKVADPAANKFVGIVIDVADTDNFTLQYGGFISLTGLTAGSVYYAQSDGTVTTTVSKMPVLIAKTTTTGYMLTSASSVRFFTDLEDVPSDYTGHGLKALRVNVAETDLEFYTPSLNPIVDTYADVAALIAAQGSQVEDAWYMVLDATADPAVVTGWAIYQYLGTTDGDIDDYFLVQKFEALELWPDLTQNETIDGATFAFEINNLSAFNILADATGFTTDLFTLTGPLLVNDGAAQLKFNETDGLAANAIGVKLFNNAASYAEGVKIIFIGEATTAPTTPPTAGIFKWSKVYSGAVQEHYMDSLGNITIR
jgi:hypothetical protein